MLDLGLRLSLGVTAYENLKAPALVSILLPGRIGHSVLLEAAEPEGVRIADPWALVGGCRRRRS